MIASYVVRSNERQGYGLGLWRLTLFQQYVSCVMVVSFIGRGRRSAHRKSPICRKSLTNYHIMLYRVHLAGAGFELTTSVVIDTHCIGICKSNYYTITTAPNSKAVTFVFFVSPLSTHNFRVRTKTGWLEITKMCPNGAIYLPADCCYSTISMLI
jgi:hypothetical protein